MAADFVGQSAKTAPVCLVCAGHVQLFDNAAIESFFGTLKTEYFHLGTPNSLDALEAGVDDYVRYYNRERIKLRLNGLSPVGYRLRNAA